jgi:hypothetical protein
LAIARSSAGDPIGEDSVGAGQHSSMPADGLVPNADTASRIAEAVLLPI